MQKNLIKPFSCVVAYCRANNGIGNNGTLPWPYLKADMRHFVDVTSSLEPLTMNSVDNAKTQLLFNSRLRAKLVEQPTADEGKRNAIIMGRKTWESIPESKRPLKDRINVVLTRSDDFQIADSENVMVFKDFETALSNLSQNLSVNEIFVIGGNSLFELAMN